MVADGDEGAVRRIPSNGRPVEPLIMDPLVDSVWPKFLPPYPLNDKYFLVSCKPSPDASWGLYLVDVFDNMQLIRELPGQALLEPLPGNPPLPVTLDAAMDAAKARSPMLAEAEAGLRAAEAAARGARAERLPTVGAFAEAGAVRDQFFPDYRADSTTVGVRARWALFSGGRVSAKIAEATSDVRTAEARMRAAEMQIEEAVIAAFQDVRTALLVESAAEDQARAAEQALTGVRHEVRVGMKPQLDLLDAEREALGAGVAAAGARTDRIAAAYRLLALIGGN